MACATTARVLNKNFALEDSLKIILAKAIFPDQNVLPFLTQRWAYDAI